MYNKVAKIRFKRSAAQNKAMMRSLFKNLLEHKMIVTTKPKAKALKMYTDKVISRAKTPNAFSNKVMMKYTSPTLFPALKKMAKQYKKRVGGFTRVVKLDKKRSDQAEMALIKFVK